MAEVLGYTVLIEKVAEASGLKKGQVRKVLEAAQKEIAVFAKANPGGRIHLGRLATFYSRMTKERMVNHPQKPGQKLVSAPHLVLRADAGSITKAFLTGERADWESPEEETPAAS